MALLTIFERRKTAIVFAVYLIAAMTLLVSTLRVFVGYDAFWHLQMGKDLVENGLSPWFDHYSFTFKGSEILAPPVLFQVTLYKLVDWLGEFNGFFAIRLASFLLALTMMSLWLRQIRAPAIVYCLVIPMLTVLLQFRAIVRPELFSYSLIILAFMLYQRTRLELTWRAMWPIAALLLFWTNYHSSILAYVIFFGLFVDTGLHLIKKGAPRSDWNAWVLWGVVLIGIGFLNPGGNHIVLQFMLFPTDWKELIQEYAAAKSLLAMPATWVLIGGLILTLFLLVKQRKFGLLAVGLVFIYAGVTMGRMVTPGGIALLCIFASTLTGQSGKWFQSVTRKAPRLIALVCIIAILVPILNGVQQARGLLGGNRVSVSGFPYELTKHMIASHKTGRIFNAYEIGGYLIYRVPRTNEVYIDGRTGILYPLEHYRKMFEASAYPDSFISEATKYEIDFSILAASEFNAVLMAEANFELDFVDLKYALWSREGGMLAAIGQIWASPYCWSKDSKSEFKKEWDQSVSKLPPTAPIMPYLSVVHEYVTSTNLNDYFKAAALESNMADSSRRFLGYRALENDKNEYALGQFSRIDEKQPKDYLAEALTQVRLGNLDEAEDLLDKFTRIQWVRLDFTDLLIQHALLHAISSHRPLQLFDTKFLDDLDLQVADSSLPARGESIAVSSFCQGQSM